MISLFGADTIPMSGAVIAAVVATLHRGDAAFTAITEAMLLVVAGGGYVRWKRAESDPAAPDAVRRLRRKTILAAVLAGVVLGALLIRP